MSKNQTIYHRAPTGGIYHAFPFNKALSEWSEYAVQLNEVPADSTNYQAIVDAGVDTLWRIFEGGLQPTDLSQAENAVVDIACSVCSQANVTTYLGKTTRNVNDQIPIEFALDTPSLNLTGTLGDGTPLAGSISFLQSEGDLHWYRLSYHQDDRPGSGGAIGYVITDGSHQYSLSLTELIGGGGGGGTPGIVGPTIDGEALPLVDNLMLAVGTDYTAENGTAFSWPINMPGVDFAASNGLFEAREHGSGRSFTGRVNFLLVQTQWFVLLEIERSELTWDALYRFELTLADSNGNLALLVTGTADVVQNLPVQI